MIRRPDEFGAFRFATLAALRAGQLMRGCTPRVDGGDHKSTVVAQLEVAGGMVGEAPNPPDPLAMLEPSVSNRPL